MKLYRVERKSDGKGPFAAKCDLPNEIWGIITVAGNRIPLPWQDGKLNELCDALGEAVIPKSFIFAFTSLSRLYYAFSPNILDTLKRYDFVVKEIEALIVLEGDTQACFHKDFVISQKEIS